MIRNSKYMKTKWIISLMAHLLFMLILMGCASSLVDPPVLA